MTRQKHTSDSGDRDRKVQPPRPPNAWILYRSFKFKTIRETNERLSQATISKRVSEMWRNEAEPIKRYWEREAETKKAEHQALYPGYRFCPKRKNEKKRKAQLPPADNDNKDFDASIPAIPPFAPALRVQSPQAQSCLLPGYSSLLQPYIVPYVPKVVYAPGGPSPPLSSAPSPAPSQGSRSLARSSSPSSRSSSLAESSDSSSSSQPPASLSNSHLPYATQPLFQPGELPTNGYYGLLSQAQFQQDISSFNSLQGTVSRTIEDSACNATDIDSSSLPTRSSSDLAPTLPSEIPAPVLNKLFSSEIDFIEFQRLVNLLAERNLHAYSSVDIPGVPQPQLPAAAPQQHQPPALTQDMMNFLDFDAAEASNPCSDLVPSGSSYSGDWNHESTHPWSL